MGCAPISSGLSPEEKNTIEGVTITAGLSVGSFYLIDSRDL